MRIILRALLLCFALGAGATAVLVLRDARGTDRINALTNLILNGDPVPDPRVEAAYEELEARGALRSCAGGASRPLVAITLHRATRSLARNEIDRLDMKLSQARAAAERSIACDPHDALGWLALAQLRILTEGASSEALRLIRFTRTLAPGEAGLMHHRAGLLIPFVPSLSDDDRTSLMADLVGLIGAEAGGAVADVLAGAPREFQIEVGKAAAGLPFRAQRIYQAAALQREVDVSSLGIPRASGDRYRPVTTPVAP